MLKSIKIFTLVSVFVIGFLGLQSCSSMSAKDGMQKSDTMDSGDMMKDDAM